jgi:hypothetical protein
MILNFTSKRFNYNMIICDLVFLSFVLNLDFLCLKVYNSSIAILKN